MEPKEDERGFTGIDDNIKQVPVLLPNPENQQQRYCTLKPVAKVK